MRVSPVAWFFDDLYRVKKEAEETAIVTHNHPEGIKGAVAIAHAIYYLRTTKNYPGLKRNANVLSYVYDRKLLHWGI